MPILKKTHLVKKRNVLNDIRATSMTLQELRFFSIYLSKINPENIDTRVVRFPLSDFQSIMELGRINIIYMKNVVDGLLCKVVEIPTENGGYRKFQLFKECLVDMDKTGEWFVEIDAHDRALPLMFDYKREFFSYKLWNTLRLKSSNQHRMYETLKRFERAGSMIISVDELKDHLGINEDEYKRYNDFKKWVLDVCQQALDENTDIKFTYEPYGRRGQGGKINQLKFIIRKNDTYIDQLTLDEFIDMNSVPEPLELGKEGTGIDIVEFEVDGINVSPLVFYSEACDNEFSHEQIQVLYDLMIQVVPFAAEDTERFDYLRRKYNEMKMRNPRANGRFGYLKKLLDIDIENMQKGQCCLRH